MAENNRIRTPWEHKLRRFRYSALPGICFLICVVVTLWMWDRQGQLPNAVGEAQWMHVTVRAGVDGRIAALQPQETWWTLCQEVSRTKVIARLDDGPVSEELAAMEEDLKSLQGQLEVTRAEFQLDGQREFRRLAWQVERLYLDELVRRVEIEAARIELQRLEARLNAVEPLVKIGGASQMEVKDTQLLRDEVQKRIHESEAVQEESRKQREEAQSRLTSYPPLLKADENNVLAPIRASIKAQQHRIDKLEMEIEALKIHSPIDGTISEVHCVPGQNVLAGDPIVTVALSKPQYIVSYIRQKQRFIPRVNMKVKVRRRAAGSPMEDAVVEKVGSMRLIPPQQLLDPTRPEWGVPVRIRLPKESSLHPGEFVDITFETN